MWIQRLALLGILLLVGSMASYADTVKLKDGTEVEGIIQKVEAGQVFVKIADEVKVFEILMVDSMDFNTPHILADTAKLPLAHFLKDVSAQEIVRNFAQLEKTEAETRSMLNAIKASWGARQPINSTELPGWEREKEEFRKPLARYQEVLNDLYFHVLARVDAYNNLASEANEVYVGVKGIRTGSSLVPKEMRQLPLKKYVPGAWYDSIYYDGYNRGYEEAFEKYRAPNSND